MKEIPITAARAIAHSYHAPEVVIFTYDPTSGMQCVTTYGITTEQSQDAAKSGNWLKKQLGWADYECNIKPTLRICPNCNSNDIIMFNKYMDVCQSCKHRFKAYYGECNE